jgi:hypothetical protein
LEGGEAVDIFYVRAIDVHALSSSRVQMGRSTCTPSRPA